MARYRTSIRTSDKPADAFAYVADLRNLVEWDPGVEKVTQVNGTGADPNAVYDVTLTSPPGYELRYETESFEGPRSVTLTAKSRLFTSIDRISAEGEPDGGDGSIVTYDAELKLNGPLMVFDLGLRLVFGRIGDRAAAGLRETLEGEFVK